MYVRSHCRIRSRTSDITKDMGLATLSINCGPWSAIRDRFASVLGWPSTSMPSTGSTVSADRVGCSSVGVEEETRRGGGCEDLVSYCEEFRGAQGLGVHVRGVELPVDLAGLDLS